MQDTIGDRSHFLFLASVSQSWGIVELAKRLSGFEEDEDSSLAFCCAVLSSIDLGLQAGVEQVSLVDLNIPGRVPSKVELVLTIDTWHERLLANVEVIDQYLLLRIAQCFQPASEKPVREQCNGHST